MAAELTTTIYRFEEEFNKRTTARRADERGRLFFSCVVIELHRVNSSTYRLTHIMTLPLLRRIGYATTALIWLCKLADVYGIQLECCPVQLDKNGLDLLRLTAWYQSLGFLRIGLDDEMVRYPTTRQYVERKNNASKDGLHLV